MTKSPDPPEDEIPWFEFQLTDMRVEFPSFEIQNIRFEPVDIFQWLEPIRDKRPPQVGGYHRGGSYMDTAAKWVRALEPVHLGICGVNIGWRCIRRAVTTDHPRRTIDPGPRLEMRW